MITGNKLKMIRSIRGLSQLELADLAGISPVSISTFESGKSDMRAGTVVKLCAALGVGVVYTLDDMEINGP